MENLETKTEDFELMSIEDVAKFMGFKRCTIDNWLFKGVLPLDLTIKIGRSRMFIKSELVEFLMSKRGLKG